MVRALCAPAHAALDRAVAAAGG